jgi:PAS domain S-box-containing protein
MTTTDLHVRHAEILIVEDSPTQAEHLKALLESKGYSLIAARDGRQALEHLDSSLPDLVISDVIMPGLGGYELCRCIKSDPRTRNIPVILLTSLTDPADVVKGLEAGADNFLFKPFDDAYLIKRIEFALISRGNEEANMSRMGLEVSFGGRKFYISSDRLQILNLLLTTFEAAVERNHELIQVRDELRVLNECLESRVQERTSELEAALARESAARSQMQRLNEQLRHSEERFRGMFMSAVVGISITDLHGKFQQANPAYCSIVGYSEEELRVLDFPSITHPDDRQGNCAQVGQILSGEVDSQIVEKRYIKKSGETVWVRVSVSAVRDANGAPLHVIAVAQDITASRKADERISDQASVLDKARDAIIVRDLERRISYWNKSAERLYGWTAAEALGQRFDQLLKINPERSQEADRAVRAHEEWRGEVHKKNRNGSTLMISCSWTLLRDPQGKPKSILHIDTDITEHKQLELQFLRSQRLDSLGTLAGGIAHDLNNLLSPIVVGIDLLRVLESREERLKTLHFMENSARRGIQMVKQVLSFARGVEGSKVSVHLGHIVREIDTMTTNTFPKDIRFETSIDNELSLVEGDPTQLNQVLLNLCVNARDAMHNGGILRVTAKNVTIDPKSAANHPGVKSGAYVLLQVIDSGTGMTPDVIERIFEPFFTTKDSGKGNGLGLSTTLGIVRSHGGVIFFLSVIG